jgi:gluconate 2-dehydrogenase gamma chain
VVGPLLRRRAFLQLLAAGGTAATVPWLPGCGDRRLLPIDTPAAHFFTASERAVIEALAETIVPEDQTVGALGADAVEYIDRYLAAFDNSLPAIYGGGPFSGRQPFPDPVTGEPSDDYPDNDFRVFLPLTRKQELTFRIDLYGSDSVPNGNINAPLVPSSPGRRTLYREAIALLESKAAESGAAAFADLDPEERLTLFRMTSPGFQTALLENIAEGMFCAPEYGGNRDGVAWRDYQWSGDSQPLGYTFYDSRNDSLRDNPERPNQTRDPSWPGNGLDPAVESFIASIVAGSGGKRFF